MAQEQLHGQQTSILKLKGPPSLWSKHVAGGNVMGEEQNMPVKSLWTSKALFGSLHFQINNSARGQSQAKFLIWGHYPRGPICNYVLVRK